MHDAVKPFLVPQTHTIRQAMEQLEKTEEKIVFVVDEASQMLGSLTDGDIRRWILSDGDLKAQVHRICNRKPYVVDEVYEPERVRGEMLGRNIGCVPVVDSSRRIVRLLFWKNLFQGAVTGKPKHPINLPVVIMAGGRGTRLEPFTNILPKPLIPVGDRTIIETIIEQFRPYGVDRFHLSINYKAKIIKSFFEELDPDYSIEYMEEDLPLGTAGSLRSLGAASAESIIVTNCDILVQADYAELVAFHAANANDITLVASLKDYRIPYGVCEIEAGGNLTKITEKPQYSFLVNTGMYLVRRDRLDLIPERERCDMPDFMGLVKAAGGRVGVFPIGENAWIDTGEWTEYRKALESLNRLGTHPALPHNG
jgi:dTDP-glucose pyrophosphorylase/CBS domain-containing protein